MADRVKTKKYGELLFTLPLIYVYYTILPIILVEDKNHMRTVFTSIIVVMFIVSVFNVSAFAKGNPNPGFPRTYNPKGITVTIPYTFVNTAKVEKGHNSNPRTQK